MKNGIIEKLKKMGLIFMCAACLVTAVPTDVSATKTDKTDETDKTDDTDKTTDKKDTTDKTTDKKDTTDKTDSSDKPDTTDEDNKVSSTSEFLIVGDCVPTPTARYGQPVHIILPIYNLGLEAVTNLVITPTVSTKPEEWPFRLDTVGLVQTVDIVPASPVKAQAYNFRREVEWDLIVRDDAPTGCYKLEYNVSYYRDGGIETATLFSFINVKGASGSGTLSESENEKSSNPRIIVTGFETDPAEVFAGDTFNLTIHVQNTSKTSSVNNVMFSLEAVQEGSDENTTYSAFLPTSGSSTIYMDSIASQQTADIKIEMTAKADLAQKPYAITVKAEYEDGQSNAFTSESNVSIPIKQVAKFDTSSIDVQPANISVDSESNVMFSIYNTGKTTLYNVQVRFEGSSITGGDSFIGKVEPGATGNVDAMVTGTQPTADEGIVKAIISYEDDAGNKKEIEKEFNLIVEQNMMPEGEMEGDYGIIEEQPKTSRLGIGILIIVIVLAAIGGLVAFLIIKKKKKAAKNLSEDLDDLLDDLDDKSVNDNSDDI